MIGWIKLHRQLLEWEWYDDINVRLVFLHCLLKANFKDKSWKGNTIKRGTFVSSYGKLSEEIGISVKQLRIALSKLERTNEMEVKSTTKNTTFQLVNYNTYQSEDKQEGKPKANEGQTEGKQRATTKEDNNIIKEEVKNKEFDLFWNLYDKKTGKEKVFKKFSKLKQNEIDEILSHVPKYVLSTPDKKYRKDPSTYLNGKHWEDEIEEVKKVIPKYHI